jgi:hypothetical protein
VFARGQAMDHPDKPAIIMAASGETVTFGEYEARANRVAHLWADGRHLPAPAADRNQNNHGFPVAARATAWGAGANPVSRCGAQVPLAPKPPARDIRPEARRPPGPGAARSVPCMPVMPLRLTARLALPGISSR